METSVIIRTLNEERHLPALLDALKEQAHRDFEVIVVDSGSVDRTVELARQRADRVIAIASRDFTFGYSLNSGIEHSRGQFIAIVSAHAIPADEHWLNKLIAPLRNSNVAMVYGRQLGVASSKFSERQDFTRTFGRTILRLRPPQFFANNANAAIRRDLWVHRRFDEMLPGLEDIEWAKYWMQHGYEVVYQPESAVYHIHEESWRQVRRRYYREAVAMWRVGLRRPSDIPRELLRELRNAVGDVAAAVREGLFSDRVGEIVRFRATKALAYSQGLFVASRVLTDPQRTNELFFDRKHKAVVIHRPGHASLEEVDLPRLKPGDVLVRMAYVGVCRTDLEILEGTLGYYSDGLAAYPITPGHECSGRVAQVGANVTGLQVGDPVTIECIQSCGECADCRRGSWVGCAARKELGVIGLNGGYAEFVAVPGQFVQVLPSGLDLRQAALCEPLAVVMKGIRRLERAWSAGLHRTCAVVGAGPIGHLAARVLALVGHHVTVFDRNPARLAMLDGCGILVSQDLKQLGEFEALVEATGDPSALAVMLEHSAPGAAVLLLGLPYARREFDFESIVAYDKTIIGSVGSGAADFRDAIGILPHLRVDSLVTFPLENFRQAWEFSKAGRSLKVLLQMSA